MRGGLNRLPPSCLPYGRPSQRIGEKFDGMCGQVLLEPTCRLRHHGTTSTKPKRRTPMGKFTDQRIYRTFEEFEREELRRDGYFESVDDDDRHHVRRRARLRRRQPQAPQPRRRRRRIARGRRERRPLAWPAQAHRGERRPLRRPELIAGGPDASRVACPVVVNRPDGAKPIRRRGTYVDRDHLAAASPASRSVSWSVGRSAGRAARRGGGSRSAAVAGSKAARRHEDAGQDLQGRERVPGGLDQVGRSGHGRQRQRSASRT